MVFVIALFSLVVFLESHQAVGFPANVKHVVNGRHRRHSLADRLLPRSKRRSHALVPEAGSPAWKRGFVVCVSGPGRETSVSDAVRTVAAIKSVRRAGNRDKVMIYHVDGELPPKEIHLLEQYKGVTVTDLKKVWDLDDLEAVDHDTNKYRSFDCKIMALLHSPFEQTMLIDSDALFFEDPARVFAHQLVRDTGTMFFYDRRALDSNPKLMKGKAKCDSIINFAHWSDLKTSMLEDFKGAHSDYCEAVSSHEQDASLVLVDRTKPVASKFLQMLKQFHTKYIVKNETVKQWGFGDKEFYWIACELAGVHCSFSPRGRPMHIFHENSFDGQVHVIRRQGDTQRPGCSAQVSLEGDGSGLLYVNLSDRYCSWERKLNAVTVWNAGQKAPTFQEGWTVRTGRGARPLSTAEQTVADAYRDDVARLHNF